MMTPKQRFLGAARREPVDRPPVWMMRQAGRYLPEYRAIRKKMSTLEMMKDPQTACEITLQPVELVGVDAAILYSDILIVPEAMGLSLDFVQGVGPVFSHPVRSRAEAEGLSEKNVPSRCPFVFEALSLIRKKVGPDFPVLGFAGAPFTVAAYVVGGDGSHDGNRIKKLAYSDLKTFRILMEKLTLATIDYLSAQITAGADAVQLFDTWAGTLTTEEYVQYALPYVREILGAIRKKGTPTILYIKGGTHLFSKMLEGRPDVISLDWRMSLGDARQIANDDVAIQGNLDPAKLYAPIPVIEESVRHMMRDWGKGPGYIVNLGHGIMPDVPVEHAKAFIEAAKKFGPETLT